MTFSYRYLLNFNLRDAADATDLKLRPPARRQSDTPAPAPPTRFFTPHVYILYVCTAVSRAPQSSMGFGTLPAHARRGSNGLTFVQQ